MLGDKVPGKDGYNSPPMAKKDIRGHLARH